MKKLISLMLVLCLVYGPVFAEEIQSDYQPIHVSLWMDSAANYEWICEYDDNGVLSAPMEELIEEGEQGGHHNFYFGVNKPGTAEIIFNYGVNYDVAVPEKTVICTVNVDENGKSAGPDRTVQCRIPQGT